VVVELVDGPRSIASQFAKIGRVILVHLLGEADVIITPNAPSLILAEKDRPLVLAHSLVVLTEPRSIPFEIDKRVLSLTERGVDGSLAFRFVEAGLVEDLMDEDVTFLRLLSLQVALVYHALDGLLLLPLLLFLGRTLLLFLLARWASEGVLSPESALLLEDVHPLLDSEFGEGFFLLDLADLLSNIIVLIGVDHLLAPLGPVPLAGILLGRALVLGRFFLLVVGLLGWLLFGGLLGDILITKINEIALVALLGFLQDVLPQLVGVEHVLSLLLNLVPVVIRRLVHHSDLVLLLLLHEFFIPV
jgi:hypothetical protein